MNITIKGGRIILSQAPKQDVKDAILVISDEDENPTYKTDVFKGVKKYKLPEGVEKRNVIALYLRIL